MLLLAVGRLRLGAPAALLTAQFPAQPLWLHCVGLPLLLPPTESGLQGDARRYGQDRVWLG